MRLTVRAASGAFVQDLGRRQAHQGIATGGARDQHAARLANALTGRSPGEPLAEVVLGRLTVLADRDALVAVTGAAEATVGGVGVETRAPLVLPAGAELVIGVTTGVAAYLAVGGSWHVPLVAGGAGPDAALGLGTALAAGAEVEVTGAPAALAVPSLGVGLLRPGIADVSADPVVDLLPGPDLGGRLRAAIADGIFTVDPRSDHVGVRFTGPLPEDGAPGDRASRGVPIGAVELPGAPGELIALQRGRSLTAGYPIVAVVGTVAQDRVGQLLPGDAVRFRWRTPRDTRMLLARQREFEQLCRNRVSNALAARG